MVKLEERKQHLLEVRVGEQRDEEQIVNINECSKEALNNIEIVVATQILDLETQLRQAKVKAQTAGEYANAEWYSKATNCLRIKKLQRNPIQQRRKEIEDDKRDARKSRLLLCEAFYAVAKENLKSPIFEMLKKYALAVVEEANTPDNSVLNFQIEVFQDTESG